MSDRQKCAFVYFTGASCAYLKKEHFDVFGAQALSHPFVPTPDTPTDRTDDEQFIATYIGGINEVGPRGGAIGDCARKGCNLQDSGHTDDCIEQAMRAAIEYERTKGRSHE